MKKESLQTMKLILNENNFVINFNNIIIQIIYNVIIQHQQSILYKATKIHQLFNIKAINQVQLNK